MNKRRRTFPPVAQVTRARAVTDAESQTVDICDTRALTPTRQVLGIELRTLRLRLGLSQRGVVRKLGLRAHSNLADYESGRRVPPNDILIACERILQVQCGYLQRIRDRILHEEAESHKEEALRLLRRNAR